MMMMMVTTTTMVMRDSDDNFCGCQQNTYADDDMWNIFFYISDFFLCFSKWLLLKLFLISFVNLRFHFKLQPSKRTDAHHALHHEYFYDIPNKLYHLPDGKFFHWSLLEIIVYLYV